MLRLIHVFPNKKNHDSRAIQDSHLSHDMASWHRGIPFLKLADGVKILGNHPHKNMSDGHSDGRPTVKRLVS